MPLPTSPELVEYIRLCREKGFEDYNIRIPLLENGWPLDEIQRAFQQVKEEDEKKLKKKEIKKSDGATKTVYVYKNTYTIHLDDEVAKIITKRAKKNLLKPEEQIEDIVRRSCASQKKKDSEPTDNVDDLFLKLFSRKSCGRPKKKQPR